MTDTIKVKQADSDPPQWYFVRVAENGEVVSTSELYTRQEDAERAAERETQTEVEVDGDQ